MAAALVLGTSGEIRVGSSPTWGTNIGSVEKLGKLAVLRSQCLRACRFDSDHSYQNKTNRKNFGYLNQT